MELHERLGHGVNGATGHALAEQTANVKNRVHAAVISALGPRLSPRQIDADLDTVALGGVR